MIFLIGIIEAEELCLKKLDLPSWGDANLYGLGEANGCLFFGSDDYLHPGSLWKTDLTEEGTVRIEPENVQYFKAQEYPTVNMNGLLFFIGYTPDTGNELWRTDGTDAGTFMVKDINPGHGDVFDSYWGLFGKETSYIVFNGYLYFAAFNGSEYEIWRTDGTIDGTVQVSDFSGSFYSDGDTLYCRTSSVLYVVDTAPAVPIFTELLSSIDGVFCTANNALFAFKKNFPYCELWKTDGTAPGTVFIESVEYDSYTPFFLGYLGTTILFINSFNNNQELWKTDGTAVGTEFVCIINNYLSYNYNNISRQTEVLGGALLFVQDGNLWKTDGTEAGTGIVKDFTGDGFDGKIFEKVNGCLIFSANDSAAGYELWCSDGTVSGTLLLKDINQSGSSYPGEDGFINTGNRLYFSADDGIRGTELWGTDGTEIGTGIVKDINPIFGWDGVDEYNSYELILGEMGGNLLLYANDGKTGGQLWKSDGTENGTSLLKVISYSIRWQFADVIEYGYKTIFIHHDGTNKGYEPWVTDGTVKGTRLIKDINPAGSSWKGYGLLNLGNGICFFADDGTNGTQLWRTDGTRNGTYRVKGDYTEISSPQLSCQLGNQLVFIPRRENSFELYCSDGSSYGTRLIRSFPDMYPEVISSGLGRIWVWVSISLPGPDLNRLVCVEPETGEISEIVTTELEMSGSVYCTDQFGFFFLYDSDGNQNLWVSDGTPGGTHCLSGIVFESEPYFEEYYFKRLASKNKFYFRGDTFANGRELWVSDGTEAGTHILKDINPGSGNSSPAYMSFIKGKLYFYAGTENEDYEPWVSDGTGDGTYLLKDINPDGDSWAGIADQYFFEFRSRVFFSAADPVNNEEIWVTKGTEERTNMFTDDTNDSISYIGIFYSGRNLYFTGVENDKTSLYVIKPVGGTGGCSFSEKTSRTPVFYCIMTVIFCITALRTRPRKSLISG